MEIGHKGLNLWSWPKHFQLLAWRKSSVQRIDNKRRSAYTDTRTHCKTLFEKT